MEEAYPQGRDKRLSDVSHCRTLQELLRVRAGSSDLHSLLLYPLGSTTHSEPRRISYTTLYDQAKRKAPTLERLPGFDKSKPVLLHLEDHCDAIVWFWTVLLADGVPVMSSPMSNVDEHRAKHLQALSSLLEGPICITREASMPLFKGSTHTFKPYTIEYLSQDAKDDQAQASTITAASGHANSSLTAAAGSGSSRNGISTTLDQPEGEAVAALMLTSGSTGNAKAVRLRHSQMLAAAAGKMSTRRMPAEGAFLNWIGMDHVAALMETHLTALWLNRDQVHVHAADVIASPLLFLELLSRHRVSWTFSPNFFLAQLVAASRRLAPETETESTSTPVASTSSWDLSNLRSLVSGGEANDIATVEAVTALLGRYGAPPNVIQPGFGMTETCAGSIYNLDCPSSDTRAGRSVASLGQCMPGCIEMRVVDETTGARLDAEQPGYLEVRGTVVFDGYYRNPDATAAAFPSGDGWFRTGDRAVIDSHGDMSMLGRAQDVINVNGIKIVTADVQVAVEAAVQGVSGVSRVVCFASRAPEAVTEQITVAYVPRDENILTGTDMNDIDRRIVQACMMVSLTGWVHIFMVRSASLPLLPVSALGKISGTKMRALFESGAFGDDTAYHRQIVEKARGDQKGGCIQTNASKEEQLLRIDFSETKNLNLGCIGLDTPIFELGFSSLDLIRLKSRISKRLGITIPTITVMKNPTVRALAAALHTLQHPDSDIIASTSPSDTANLSTNSSVMDYDPIVVLREGGTKTPLWLVHPGVGEVLVFVGLAQHMRDDDRPIYALRAPGFESNQRSFANISEAVETYASAIQTKQSKGPYALAGYSYGAMLAFETAKRIESTGATIGFLGSFNLPPHIKYRMRQLTWNMCLLHLGQFLDVISDETVNHAAEHDTTYREATRDAALQHLLGLADTERLRELGLDAPALRRWADVAYGLQSMAVDYEPTGSTPVLDVFHAEPLRVAAASRHEWVTEQLSRWADFCRSTPRMHEVGGGHYTMLGAEHVVSFAKTLRAALEARGI
ncbi:non-ribosomal peptide synthase-like protein [Apiospora kogelbergensis]|uniref:non-ribosomal peptide synthase-like protein n=1 Tax=Apiospora kogelbergensis TaxID=1337665 RepID=UPI00312ECEFD